jgi:hypothetical protein
MDLRKFVPGSPLVPVLTASLIAVAGFLMIYVKGGELYLLSDELIFFPISIAWTVIAWYACSLPRTTHRSYFRFCRGCRWLTKFCD